MQRPSTECSTEEIRRFADRLGHGVAGSELDRIAELVDSELDSYMTLTGERPPRSPSDHPQDVTIDPGAEADPYNAFLATFTLDGAETGPLDGLDVALKDNTAVAGVPTTCGSRVFETAVPSEHATVVDRLRTAGGRIVGKTNMDEMAYGPTSETSQFGPVRNPVDREHVAGGSSSGSAAAVAAGEVDVALGTDTGGSVRIPSSLCGIVGVKPSYGAVSRSGIVDAAPSMDHVGSIAPDVATAARVLDAVVGSDPRDPASAAADRLGATTDAVDDPPALETCSFGLPSELFADHVDEGVEARVRAVVDELTDAGATVETVSLPTVPALETVWKAIVNTELAAMFLASGAPVARRRSVDTAWYDAAADAVAARGHAFGETVRAMTIAGTWILDRGNGRQYTRALEIRERFTAELDRALEGHDALLSPTTPATAPTVSADSDARRVPLAYNTRPADLAHVPAVSLPAGRVDGLPIGLQLYGQRYEDAALLGVARAIERRV